MFCNQCGSSYDVRLCPARHMNLRTALACSECGSRDLSTPQPQLSLGPRIALWFAPILAGLLLILLSLVAFVGILNTIASGRQIPPSLAMGLLLLASLWFCYLHLAISFHGLFRTIWRKTKRDR